MAAIMSDESKIGSILRLTRHSAVYGFGHVLTKSLVILLLPIHTNYVNRSEYGIATQLFAFLAISSIIYSYGLNTALLQFYIQEKDIKQKNYLFSTAFFSTLLTAIGFSFIIFSLKGIIGRFLFASDNYSYLLNYSIAILTVDALVLLSFNILRAEQNSAQFAFFSVTNVALNLALNIIFVAKLSFGVKGIFLANVFSSLLIFLLLLPMTMKHLKISISRSLLIKMLIFGLPFVPSTLAIIVMNSVDRIFVNQFLGLQAAGLYGAGYKLGLIIKLFISGFQYAWIPFFISTAKQSNAKEIFSKVLTYFAIICSLIFLFLTLYIDQLVRLNIFGFCIFGKEYWGSTIIVPPILAAYIAYGFYLNLMVGVYLKEKSKMLIFVTACGAIINLMGNYFLIPLFNISGAAYASVFSHVTMALLIYFLSQKYYPIKYEMIKLIKIIVFSLTIFLIFSFVKLPMETVSKLLLLALYIIALFFAGIFDPAEVNHLKKLIKLVGK